MSPPLPDASKKSPRVYRNLQTKTLEDVTFANVEGTGDPLSVELHNEDELRRLVLVQLARLTVKSEWSGLLTSSAVSFPLLAPDGSSAAPSYSFSGASTYGMYREGSNLKFSVGGEKLRVSASGLQAIPSGSSAVPSISFTPDSSSGLFLPATNNIAIGTDGSERIRVGDAGQIGIAGANYGTDGQVLTSKGASAAVEWADASSGGGKPFGYLIATPFDNTYKYFQVSNMAPFSSINFSTSSTMFVTTRPKALPFIAPFAGTIDDAQIVVNTGVTGAKINVGIYTLNSNNYPDAKVAEIEFDAGSSGTKSSGTISQTSDLVAGDPYYYVFWKYGGASSPQCDAIGYQATSAIAPGFALNSAQAPNSITGANLTTGTSLPATFNLVGADGPSTNNRALLALIKNP